MTTDTLGPSTRIGDGNPPTNLATKATLASSASIDDRRDPSPSLLSAARRGSGIRDALLGLDIAHRTDAVADASRSAGEEGILADVAAPRRTGGEGGG